MADVVLNRRQILSIMEGEEIEPRFSNFEDFAFLPVPLAIAVIEKEKKSGGKLPKDLKNVIADLPACVSTIPLSQQGLYSAMNDQDFANKYVNRGGNPLEFATEATVYEYEEWWDRVELLGSIVELSWT